jgi:16S rRNA processing protein RimM
VTRQASRIVVGQINSPWGLRGHVKVTPLTSNPERLQPGAVVLVDGQRREIVDVRSPKGYPCIQFEGVRDMHTAEQLRGTIIEIDEDDLPSLPEGTHYIHDLVGLRVVANGEELGTLVEVLHTGANDVYLVRRDGRRDALIPAIPDVIREIDIEAGQMVIEPLPGLLDDG